MGLDSRLAQIVALTVAVAAIMSLLWLTGAWGQDRAVGEPIISDVKVDTLKALRIVTKDEIQREFNNSTLRMQKIEKDIRILKSHIMNLQNQIAELEKQIGGG